MTAIIVYKRLARFVFAVKEGNMPESYRETDDRSRLRRLDDEIQTLKRKECFAEELSRLERLEDHIWTLRTERLKNEIAMLHTELASTEAFGERKILKSKRNPQNNASVRKRSYVRCSPITKSVGNHMDDGP